MMKKVLVAEPREVLRYGLCGVFQEDTSVSEVNGVATQDELLQCLSSSDADLVIVSQILITDIRMLPQRRFALLIDEPDIDMLTSAYEHHARGYFSTSITADLLRATLSSPRDTFLVDPELLPWMIELITTFRKRTTELALLSPREREVAILLEEGLDRYTIAQRLSISGTTLKTHINNIAHKQEDAHFFQKMAEGQNNLAQAQRKFRKNRKQISKTSFEQNAI